MSKQTKLETLLNLEGFENDIKAGTEWISDSVVPGICMNSDCDATYDYEPDQTQGWCEECSTNTVVSGLVLMGVV